MNENCGNCRFFRAKGGSSVEGTCRRMPPVYSVGSWGNQFSTAHSGFRWPTVDADADWCGEHLLPPPSHKKP